MLEKANPKRHRLTMMKGVTIRTRAAAGKEFIFISWIFCSDYESRFAIRADVTWPQFVAAAANFETANATVPLPLKMLRYRRSRAFLASVFDLSIFVF